MAGEELTTCKWGLKDTDKQVQHTKTHTQFSKAVLCPYMEVRCCTQRNSGICIILEVLALYKRQYESPQTGFFPKVHICAAVKHLPGVIGNPSNLIFTKRLFPERCLDTEVAE